MEVKVIEKNKAMPSGPKSPVSTFTPMSAKPSTDPMPFSISLGAQDFTMPNPAGATMEACGTIFFDRFAASCVYLFTTHMVHS